jgi:hypothetical protein
LWRLLFLPEDNGVEEEQELYIEMALDQLNFTPNTAMTFF